MLITTLNKIREHGPCEDGWELLLKNLGKTRADDAPLPLESILESNGLDDAIWALRAVQGHDGAIRLYACSCARYALTIFEKAYPEDTRPRHAIETAERYARGEATDKELAAARDAARAAARDAARAAIAAARDAARAAAYAARDAAEAARDAAAKAVFAREFLRLCRLEGEYGEASTNL